MIRSVIWKKVKRKRSTHMRFSERAAHRLKGSLKYGMRKVAFEPGD